MLSDGLLLMETTRLVVAVTQHVVLMVELLLPFVVSSRFKIACDTSSAVINLFSLSRCSVGRQGHIRSCNGSRAAEDFNWFSINGKTYSRFWFGLCSLTDFDLSVLYKWGNW